MKALKFTECPIRCENRDKCHKKDYCRLQYDLGAKGCNFWKENLNKAKEASK